MPLEIAFKSVAAKYVANLDTPTQNRIHDKLRLIAADPLNLHLSKPLINSAKRSTRVGTWRILFLIEADTIVVTDVAFRGQVYRNL